ncbi:hypothetical protein GCM10009846_24610 [Agrococcus versicolor]|uniref:Secreted protein n=1 Tax=Agrococcus versicolor TaxID=501482 RepID=A0ABP5MM82_9MICO
MTGRTHGAIAAAILTVVLAGCAAPAQEVEQEQVGSSPSAAPSAAPSVEPALEPTTFTTRNGTAWFLLPDGWTVEDTSMLDPLSDRGGPVWQNQIVLRDAEGAERAAYADGYADDVGAAMEVDVVRSIPMADGLHAAAWWSTTGEGDVWHVHATVVQDLAQPGSTVRPEGFDRLHSFSAGLASVPACAAVVDEATAITCLESPGATDALELLATLDLAALPWDAMPDDVDPQADVPWIEFVSADGAIAFSHPASWTVRDQPWSEHPFLTLVTPDGSEALDVRLDPGAAPHAASCEQPEWAAEMRFTLLSAEAVEPAADAAPLELATFRLGSGDIGVAIMTADRVAQGCLEPEIVLGQAILQVTTPYATDAPGMILERFPGGAGFVGSYEHAVMLDVARSVEVRVIPG